MMDKNVYLQEAFKALDILNEEDFSLSSVDGLKDAKEFIDKDKESDFIDIIDPEAETEKELKDSYVGDVILDCCVCHSKIYKNPEEVHISEDEELANIDEECPFCYSTDGYQIVGMVAPYEEYGEKETLAVSDDDGKIEVSDDDKEIKVESLNEATQVNNSYYPGMYTIDEKDAEYFRNLLGPEFNVDLEESPPKSGFMTMTIQLNNPWVSGFMTSTKELDQAIKDYFASQDKNIEVQTNNTGLSIWLARRNFKNESLQESIKSVLSRLNEAEMSPEDKRDSEVLWGILDRPQYLFGYGHDDDYLSDEEKAVLKKYNLPAYDVKTKAYPYLDSENKSKINLADKIRKTNTRGKYGYEGTLRDKNSFDSEDTRYISSSDDHRYYKDPNTGSFRQLKDKGLLDKERTDQNIRMNQPVRLMKKFIDRRQDRIDDYKAAGDNYQNKRRELEKEYELKSNELDKDFRDLSDAKFKRIIDSHNDITQLLDKHRKKNESLKEENCEECDKKPVKEHFEKVEIETDTEKLEMSSEPGGKTVITTEPKETSEVIAPVSDELQVEINPIKDEPEEEMPAEDEFQDVDVEEFSEEDFDELGESYLKKIYENVNSFKTSKIMTADNKLVVEGIIGFNSGKQKKTSFVFESKDITKRGKVRFIGENLQMSRGKKAFTLTGKIDNGKFIAESLNYNYRAKDASGKSTRLYGTVKKSK